MRITVLFLAAFMMLSCGGKMEKSWTIKDFKTKQVLSLKAPDNKDVSNANVYFEGDFEGTIKLKNFGSNSISEYNMKNLPPKLFVDFYGGRFEITILPSVARGKLKVKIQIPYGY